MLSFLKNWTLPVAMLTGLLGYLAFTCLDFLAPLKPFSLSLVEWLMPLLIFSQLLLTFCKVRVAELVPVKWHALLLMFQLFTSTLMALAVICFDTTGMSRVAIEGAMVCLVCPTATAAAVITNKLGGSASTLSTYTLLSNILAAVMVPFLFPVVEPHDGLTFLAAFFKILGKVFPLLLCPFFLSLILRSFVKPVYILLTNCKDLAFYLWSVALAIVTTQTIRSVVNSGTTPGVEIVAALVGLVACGLQFWLGKTIGGKCGDRISAGQALGQKNTVLAIWMAYTYFDPIVSVAPGAYVLWQNAFNSWQLWKKRKKEENAL